MTDRDSIGRAVEFLDTAALLPSLAGDGWRASIRYLLERCLGITRAREIFQHAARSERPEEALLEGFGLEAKAPEVTASLVGPGPLVVVANHPFGGADALALIALCLRGRRDFRILANEIAASAPGIGPWVIPLSILGARGSARRNARALREALDHLRSGGLLAVFPAGEVSTWRPNLACVADGPWSTHIAALAIKARAPVLPVRFFGANPAWFHLAGALHPFLRTALLPAVLLGFRGRTLACRAGERISPDSLAEAADPTALLRSALEHVQF
ncbi:MAG: 1-acyl-sn-glycerol-3-phosphate acyltransferase [Verrucomicrobiales bacterium]